MYVYCIRIKSETFFFLDACEYNTRERGKISYFKVSPLLILTKYLIKKFKYLDLGLHLRLFNCGNRKNKTLHSYRKICILFVASQINFYEEHKINVVCNG